MAGKTWRVSGSCGSGGFPPHVCHCVKSEVPVAGHATAVERHAHIQKTGPAAANVEESMRPQLELAEGWLLKS